MVGIPDNRLTRFVGNALAPLLGIAATYAAVALLGSYLLWEWWTPWPRGPLTRLLALVIVAYWVREAWRDPPFKRRG